MVPQDLFDQLDRNAHRLEALVDGVSEGQARWRPAPDSWSVVEVANHLLDEEREDFRVRLDITLHRGHEPWPEIDPPGWVQAREYNRQDLAASWTRFRRERDASLEWLSGLEGPDWEASYETPFGPMRAGDILGAWVTHDLLHMRQLVELHHAYAVRLAAPYDVAYAGIW